ncbi:conserved hypothetical protein [Sphingomonas aurantiaca]|uniref:Plasmid recombination enzyme n=1 Tax=Sphingomonas aurantiaca TaxID=185949 RepID=A0A5E7ZMH5_9SPHN|nr:plasmid recombination protein [Sphingomonas aurantiaca]VVT17743.1 conserved hypothetical protein [Sphingomonas aurantiaca]
MYAIITFRDSGPIKSWSAMQAANVHNARTKPLAHAMPNAPAPRFLVGGKDLVADVKKKLTLANIDPRRLRKNGVIAYEAILTASADFFEQGTDEERRQRLEDWTAAQVAWAMKRYGAHRVASMVLHEDEKTNHIHLVILPLEVKSDGRRKDAELRWSLVGRTISGPGKFDEAQDVYAAEMARFGLSRGVKGSGRKHEPVPVYLARMAAKEQAVDGARVAVAEQEVAVAADRDQIVRERSSLAAGFDHLGREAVRLKDDRSAIDAAAAALDAARADHAALVLQHAREDEARCRDLDRDRQAVVAAAAEDRRKLTLERADLAKSKAEHDAKVAEAERRVAADRADIRQQLTAIAETRGQLVRAAVGQRAEISATKRALEAATALQQEAEADRAAAAEDRARAKTTAAKIEQHRVHLLPTLRAAAEFRKRAEAVRGQSLTPMASATRAAVADLHTATSTITAPAHEVRPDMLAAYAVIRQNSAGLGR